MQMLLIPNMEYLIFSSCNMGTHGLLVWPLVPVLQLLRNTFLEADNLPGDLTTYANHWIRFIHIPERFNCVYHGKSWKVKLG